ncbi:hypothetical protein NEMBOFW57_009215 [Staphylotrichum longicolle]|uniref:Cytochrome P450 n=1 Tax=Staphylotrichum longicolle TaxID=669026 RepID=A0AAD4HVS5_9PEZI|nr:hypothetical protein NEMBOFW57_009215 [Staphylotrichum longicolle]
MNSTLTSKMTVQDALVDNGLLGKGTRSLLMAVAITYAISWINWFFTSWQSSRAVAAAKRAGPGQLKRPPTLPSAVPVVGHIFQFLLGGHAFMSRAAKHYGLGVPVRINLATFPSYIVSGRDCVAAFLKDQGRQLSRIPRGLNYMEHAFGCPHEFVHQFKPRDDVDIEHQMHTALQTMLAGNGLEVLAGRYQTEVAHAALSTSLVGKEHEWTELPDLCSFVEDHVLEAATRALYGPHLVALNPTLARDFWTFNRRVKSMFMGVPKWLNPSAVRARDKMTDNVKRWQLYAAEHCNIDEIPDDVEWEPFYGSRYTRVRQKLLTKRDIMNESARAAENLAFIWAYVTTFNSMSGVC